MATSIKSLLSASSTRGRARVLVLAAAACTALILGAAPPAGAAPTAGSAQISVPAPPGGVNVKGLYSGVSLGVADQEIAAARQLHARVVRAELRWSTLEPLAASQIDPHAVAFTDRLVADAAAAGIRVIFTVDSTPCWASSAPAALLRKCLPGGLTRAANAWPPRNPADYAAAVAFIARRYGTQLAAIEVWNEPDQANQLYFAGPKKAQRYAAILRAAYVAVKGADPTVPVLGGSLVGSNGAFLRALYAAGIKGYYDGLAIHYYSLVLASVRAIHEVQLANGDGKPLWLDEFGWSSCYPRRIQEEQACVTARVQAQNLRDAVRAVARAPYVAAIVVYDLQNSHGEQFGVLASSGARKPAFGALAQALTAPFGNVRRATLALRRRGHSVIARGSAPVGDYMQLEAFAGGALRYRALFTLDRFNRYSIPLPAALGTHGLIVRVFQYWAGLGKAALAQI